MHIADAIQEQLLQLEADGRSRHTRRQYERHLKLFARWCADVGHSGDVREVDHRLLARFFTSDTAQTSATGGTKKPTSLNTLRSSLRTFFRFAHEAGIIETNPARLLRRALCGTPPPRALDDADRQRLLDALDEGESDAARRDRMLVRLLLGTGLRIGSAVGLDVDDIDCERSEIRVRVAKGRRPDTVFMPRALAEEMRDFIGNRRDGPLFCTEGEGRISIRHAQRRFAAWTTKAAMRRPGSLHGLRHDFATRLYERTQDLLLVQRALGHRSPESTGLYARASDASLRGAIEV